MYTILSAVLACVSATATCGETRAIPAGTLAPVSQIISATFSPTGRDIAFLGKGSRGKKKKKPANPWHVPSHDFDDPLSEIIFYGIGLVVVLAMLAYVIINKIE